MQSWYCTPSIEPTYCYYTKQSTSLQYACAMNGGATRVARWKHQTFVAVAMKNIRASRQWTLSAIVIAARSVFEVIVQRVTSSSFKIRFQMGRRTSKGMAEGASWGIN
jgi:hypothetical protein